MNTRRVYSITGVLLGIGVCLGLASVPANAQTDTHAKNAIVQSFEQNVMSSYEALDKAVQGGDRKAITGKMRDLYKALVRHQVSLEALGATPPAASAVKPRFVNSPTTVQGVPHILEVQVPQSLIDQRDIWVAVRPVKAPDQIWRQGSRIFTPNARQTVYLGLRGPVNEQFEVLLLTVPKKTFTKDGPFKTADIEKYGVKIVASHVIHRTR